MRDLISSISSNGIKLIQTQENINNALEKINLIRSEFQQYDKFNDSSKESLCNAYENAINESEKEIKLIKEIVTSIESIQNSEKSNIKIPLPISSIPSKNLDLEVNTNPQENPIIENSNKNENQQDESIKNVLDVISEKSKPDEKKILQENEQKLENENKENEKHSSILRTEVKDDAKNKPLTIETKDQKKYAKPTSYISEDERPQHSAKDKPQEEYELDRSNKQYRDGNTIKVADQNQLRRKHIDQTKKRGREETENDAVSDNDTKGKPYKYRTDGGKEEGEFDDHYNKKKNLGKNNFDDTRSKPQYSAPNKSSHSSRTSPKNNDQNQNFLKHRDYDKTVSRNQQPEFSSSKKNITDKDKERERDRDRDRNRDYERERNRDRDRNREKNRERDRERERNRDREKERERDRSSSKYENSSQKTRKPTDGTRTKEERDSGSKYSNIGQSRSREYQSSTYDQRDNNREYSKSTNITNEKSKGETNVISPSISWPPNNKLVEEVSSHHNTQARVQDKDMDTDWNRQWNSSSNKSSHGGSRASPQPISKQDTVISMKSNNEEKQKDGKPSSDQKDTRKIDNNNEKSNSPSGISTSSLRSNSGPSSTNLRGSETLKQSGGTSGRSSSRIRNHGNGSDMGQASDTGSYKGKNGQPVAEQRNIGFTNNFTVGSFVAARIPGDDGQNEDWILATLKRVIPNRNRYVVEDADDEVGTYTAKTQYELDAKNILFVADSIKTVVNLSNPNFGTNSRRKNSSDITQSKSIGPGDQKRLISTQNISVGDRVIGIYPGTTVFYYGIVKLTPNQNRNSLASFTAGILQLGYPPVVITLINRWEKFYASKPLFKIAFDNDEGKLIDVPAILVIKQS
ncbi:hypothetical protein BB559_005484 [Furculomyces boomerangus]|uniref:SGF29 C-terminal domain-containing protein n=1 Tax=Furculomyces boomerangus TaxID=61424 RepID=A0A2T9Y8I4_9FUNG|nr:hypothetical protein BB559_005484 [Furculomyces boomerangus]